VNYGLREAIDFVLPRGDGGERAPSRDSQISYFPLRISSTHSLLSALGQINPARAVAPSGLGSGAVTIGYRKTRTAAGRALRLLQHSLGGTSATTAPPP